MHLAILKEKLEKEAAALKDKAGKVCMFSESGPTSMALMRAVVAVIEAQATEIGELKKRIERQT